MKSIVIEQLEQRGLLEIFNEKDYLSHKRKAQRIGKGGNRYWTALRIFDLFVLNAKY